MWDAPVSPTLKYAPPGCCPWEVALRGHPQVILSSSYGDHSNQSVLGSCFFWVISEEVRSPRRIFLEQMHCRTLQGEHSSLAREILHMQSASWKSALREVLWGLIIKDIRYKWTLYPLKVTLRSCHWWVSCEVLKWTEKLSFVCHPWEASVLENINEQVPLLLKLP